MKRALLALLVLAGCSPSGSSTSASMDAAADASADAAAPGRDGAPVDRTVVPPPDVSPDVTGVCAERPAGAVTRWLVPSSLTLPAGHEVQFVLCGLTGELGTAPDRLNLQVSDLKIVYPGLPGELKVLGVGVGSATVAVRVVGEGGDPATATVTVTPSDLALEIQSPFLSVGLYDADELRVVASEGGQTRELTVWTNVAFSDPAVMARGVLRVGPVLPSNFVVGLAPGQVEVAATFAGTTTKKMVTVSGPPARDPTVSPMSFTARVGDSQSLLPLLLVQPNPALTVGVEDQIWTVTPPGLIEQRMFGFYFCALPGDGKISVKLFDRTLDIALHCTGN